VQGVVPHPEIAPLLQAHFVALASDCDDPEPEVLALAQGLKNARMLPFVIFADSSGRFVRGGSGAVSPASFKKTLEELAAR
jgi:hypothetical protein